MSRPLRLTAEEALALVVALRTLAETPGVADAGAVERALAKVESAAGGHVEAADAVQVALDAETRLIPVLQTALDGQRALELRYYTAARDETTVRVVDPVRLFDLRRTGLPGGLVPAGRGGACLPGRPDRGRTRAGRTGPSTGRSTRPGPERGGLRPGTGAPARRSPGRAGVRLGRGLLRGRTRRRGRRAGGRSACGWPIPPGCGRWSSARPARSRCSRRAGWPTRSSARPGRRWRPTTASGNTAGSAAPPPHRPVSRVRRCDRVERNRRGRAGRDGAARFLRLRAHLEGAAPETGPCRTASRHR